MDSVIEVVANFIKEAVETTFIPGRIDHSPNASQYNGTSKIRGFLISLFRK
jgi:hypothetical protein